MSEAVETIEYLGHTIEIYQDEADFSPREWENICVMHLGHRRYAFGDKNYSSFEEIQAVEREAKAKGDICIPMYMYDHSGIALSLSNASYPFNDRWDAGRCGFMQVQKSEIMANWGKKNWTKKLREKALEVAEGEIKEMNSYLCGEIYRYDIDNGEESCGGFIGDIKYCIEEAEGCVECTVKYLIKKHCEQLKKWILNKVPMANRHSLQTA